MLESAVETRPAARCSSFKKSDPIFFEDESDLPQYYRKLSKTVDACYVTSC
jgi:hypothetical protein